MKANEAPEKLCLHPTAKGNVGASWLTFPLTNEDIEYIRKDAFIEKACSWLRTHSEADYFELIPYANYCGAGNLNKKKMIEDFKKYMEE